MKWVIFDIICACTFMALVVAEAVCVDGVRSCGHVLQVHNNCVSFLCTDEGSEVTQPLGFLYLLPVGGVSVLLIHCLLIHPPDPLLSPLQKHPCISAKHRHIILCEAFTCTLSLTESLPRRQRSVGPDQWNPCVPGLIWADTMLCCLGSDLQPYPGTILFLYKLLKEKRMVHFRAEDLLKCCMIWDLIHNHCINIQIGTRPFLSVSVGFLEC